MQQQKETGKNATSSPALKGENMLLGVVNDQTIGSQDENLEKAMANIEETKASSKPKQQSSSSDKETSILIEDEQ